MSQILLCILSMSVIVVHMVLVVLSSVMHWILLSLLVTPTEPGCLTSKYSE